MCCMIYTYADVSFSMAWNKLPGPEKPFPICLCKKSIERVFF
jgi:hypothetical protein